MKRIFCVFLCLCMLAALLAGCASTNEESSAIESLVESVAESSAETSEEQLASSAESSVESETSGSEETARREDITEQVALVYKPMLDAVSERTESGWVSNTFDDPGSTFHGANIDMLLLSALTKNDFSQGDKVCHMKVVIRRNWETSLTDAEMQERVGLLDSLGIRYEPCDGETAYCYHAEIGYRDIVELQELGGYEFYPCYCEDGFGDPMEWLT